MKSAFLTLIGLLASIVPASAQHVADAKLANSSNAVWLGHAYVSTASTVALVPKTAAFLKEHQVDYFFVNVGRVDKTGRLPAGTRTQIVNFLDTLAGWETTNKHSFKVLAWINGSVDETNAERFVDINQANLRSAIADEAKKFVDAKLPQSYIAGAKRTFDGVQIDLEPAGGSEQKAANLFSLMEEIRQKIGADKLTSFTPHKIGDRNRYWSNAEFYYGMGQRVDLICAMTYDMGQTDASVYRAWVEQQTIEIMRAVSGATWNNDAKHPQPKESVKTFIGFPAFPANKWHDVKVETITDAAFGTRQALEKLKKTNPETLRYFGGGAVYLYTDGTGTDSYSNPQNWAEFKSVWLQK